MADDDGAYEERIFINCPYDAAYTPILEAIVFAIIAAGFRAVSARERLNSAETRLHKILEMIASCKYSIHDLSRVELDTATQLPRFNMPLELGIDLGCRHYHRTDKVLLILDSDKHRYQRYVSDLAGQDIAEHGNSPAIAVSQVRNWLLGTTHTPVPGSRQLLNRYVEFRADFSNICRQLGHDETDLSFRDFSFVVGWWLRERRDL